MMAVSSTCIEMHRYLICFYKNVHKCNNNTDIMTDSNAWHKTVQKQQSGSVEANYCCKPLQQLNSQSKHYRYMALQLTDRDSNTRNKFIKMNHGTSKLKISISCRIKSSFTDEFPGHLFILPQFFWMFVKVHNSFADTAVFQSIGRHGRKLHSTSGSAAIQYSKQGTKIIICIQLKTAIFALTLLDGLQDDHLVCKNYIKRCYTEIVQMNCSVCHPCNLQHLLLHDNPGWFGYWVTHVVLETGH